MPPKAGQPVALRASGGAEALAVADADVRQEPQVDQLDVGGDHTMTVIERVNAAERRSAAHSENFVGEQRPGPLGGRVSKLFALNQVHHGWKLGIGTWVSWQPMQDHVFVNLLAQGRREVTCTSPSGM